MENQAAALGPRPADRSAAPLPLSVQRLQVLQVLRRTGPHTIAALADATGLHVNTVREHVEGLWAARLLTRERVPASGRGRPAWRYSARPPDESLSMRDHVALATALAGHLARTSSCPAADAAVAGQEWGRALTEGRPAAATSLAARQEVVGLLDAAGFAPDADDDARTVRLRQCPLLEVARRYPDVVCGVHTGLVTAALETLGDPDGARQVRLRPFAVPGACLLHLGPP
ncbi:MAG TPA: hypothetical protein VI248_14310 [Kineosporiaceae bacterium]